MAKIVGRQRKVQWLVRTTEDEADVLRAAAAQYRGTVAAFFRYAALQMAAHRVKTLRAKALR